VCVVESRAGRAGRDAEQFGDLARRVAHEVVQGENRPLLRRKPPEPAFELIPEFDRHQLVGRGRPIRRQDPKVDNPTSFAGRLDDAKVDDEAPKPGVESIWIAEPSQVSPGDHQRVLQGVLSSIDVAKDSLRDREELVGAWADQVDVCRPISLCRRFDEITIHPLLVPSWRP